MKRFFIVSVFVMVVLLGCSRKGDFSIELIGRNSANLVNNTQRTATFDLLYGETIGTVYMWKELKIVERFDVDIIPLELKRDQIVEHTKYRWRLILRPGEKLVITSDGFDKSLYKDYTEVEFSTELYIDEKERVKIELYKTLWL
jgi:hypothetical protein